jgi:GntR family transcriptional regulator of arabinose operon
MTPLYRRITNDFIERIERGDLQPGDRIPTEAELQRSYNVSRITVARAIRDLQVRDLVYRVKGSGTFISKKSVGGFSNRGTRHNGMSIISVLFAQGEQNGAHKMLVGIEGECAKDGIYVTFHNSRNKPGAERETIEKLRGQGCGGLLVLPCFASQQNLGLYTEMQISGFPIVFVDRRIDFVDIPLVASDNRGAMRALVTYLISCGHRRIGFFCNSIEAVSSERERYRGYCDAHIEARLPVDPRLVFRRYTSLSIPTEIFSIDTVNRRHYADEALDYFLRSGDRPSCVTAVNDILAVALMKAALAKGVRVPDDLSLTGFDDLSVTEHLEVPLTTVHQPFEQIGIAGARRLMELITVGDRACPGEDVRVPAEIVLRSSVLSRD